MGEASPTRTESHPPKSTDRPVLGSWLERGAQLELSAPVAFGDIDGATWCAATRGRARSAPAPQQPLRQPGLPESPSSWSAGPRKPTSRRTRRTASIKTGGFSGSPTRLPGSRVGKDPHAGQGGFRGGEAGALCSRPPKRAPTQRFPRGLRTLCLHRQGFNTCLNN